MVVTEDDKMDSQSSYTPSPAASPTNNNPSPHPDPTMPSAEEKKAVGTFLAHLKAKAKAKGQSLNFKPPTISAATVQYTLKPEGGFPAVYGHNATHTFDNIDLVQITDWMNLPGPCVFVQPLAHGFYPPPIAQEIVGALQSTVKDIFACENVKVTAPMASSAPTNIDHVPFTYMI